jgi:hypothetical protein
MADDAIVAGNHIIIKPSLASPVADWYGGVGIMDYWSKGGTITRNRITFDESYIEPLHSNGAILMLGSGGTISSNRIEGFGQTAVGVFSGGSLILNNDLENFSSWRADVIFAPGASNNLLVGKGGTVLDWYAVEGEDRIESGNVFIGDWDAAVCDAAGEYWAYRP